MKKILFGIFLLLGLGLGFFIYEFGSDFGLNFGGKNLEPKTYEEIKENFKKDSKNLSPEDAYLLAKNEDEEKYYRALYEAYKKEDKDIALQYLYNECVINNNLKVYPILRDKVSSNVTYTATETGYNGAVKNLVSKFENDLFTFVPKFYDSKTKDECAYTFYSCFFPEYPQKFLDEGSESPKIDINYIDKDGVEKIGGSPSGYQVGGENIYFKNFDGKTVLAISMTDNGFTAATEGFVPVIEQIYIYKDYSMTSTLVIQGGWGTQYRSWGIGSYKPFGPMDDIRYYKGEEEISKEEFEKNVVPIDKLVNISKEESKSWIKISTRGILGSHMGQSENENGDEDRSNWQTALTNMILYGYDISLDQEVDLPYLRAYLKHLYTNKYSSILVDSNEAFGDGRDCFFASVCDLDKDGYPEIIMNYFLQIKERDLYEYHTKVIAYDPEKKSTYILGEFLSYDDLMAIFEESNMGGIYTDNNKNYLAVILDSNTKYAGTQSIALYEKVGNKLKCIESSIKTSDAGIHNEYLRKYNKEIETYPKDNDSESTLGFRSMDYPKEDKENNLFIGWEKPGENSKEKYENLYDKVISKSVRGKLSMPYTKVTYHFEYGNVFNSVAVNDIDEIMDILLANKNIKVPTYKRLEIGENYYPLEAILDQDGKTYINLKLLKAVKNLKIDKDKADIVEKDKAKYINLEDLKKLELVTSESKELIRLKEEV